MNKILFILLFSSSLLFSVESLKILDNEVAVQINGLTKKLQANQIIELKECDTVYYVSGKGKIKIKNLIFGNNTPIKTYKTTCTENYFTSITGKLLASSEATKFGVSLRGNSTKNQTSEYYLELPKNNKKIIEDDFVATQELLFVNSKKYYPLPVLLEIFDDKNHLIYSQENNSDAKTIFKIDMQIINTGYHLIIKSIRTDEIFVNIFFK